MPPRADKLKKKMDSEAPMDEKRAKLTDTGEQEHMKKESQVLVGMEDQPIDNAEVHRVSAQFKTETGEVTGTPFELPVNMTVDQMRRLINILLQKDESVPYSFFIDDTEITENLENTLKVVCEGKKTSEHIVSIVYQPQAVFRVRAVTRCTSSITGHASSILCLGFSPMGRYLASGSGDKTVRFWDIYTETPQHTCTDHASWILSLAWSPDEKKLASGCQQGKVCVWDPETGKQFGNTLHGHKKWINALSWRPFHLDPECRFLASASKDGCIKIWDILTFQCHMALSGHPASVTCLRWGGSDLIYSGSQDRTIRVWRAKDGAVCRELKGHAHWVNFLALNTDYVMRTGAYDPANAQVVHEHLGGSGEDLAQKAQLRYDAVKGSEPERLVSGSEDFTMIMWTPEVSSKEVIRMTGHSKCVNHVLFSPDVRLLASASFDKSVKLWDGRTGKFLATLRGHVQSVYQVAWSADSRLLVSCSADSTLKLWDVKTHHLLHDLPGHEDQVFALDWSPDSQRVASGGKDKVLKIWRP